MSTAIVQFSKDLVPYGKTFQSVLPSHISPEKFMRTIVGAVQNNPDILSCDRQTIYSSCQKAAQDGLILDGREAALVKFNGKEGPTCQYMPMVRGLLKKIRNSGKVSTIRAEIVCKMDAFSFNPAKDEIPNHNPDWFEVEGSRGDMIGAYAVCKLKDGNYEVEIMSLKDIEKVRKKSKSGNDFKTNKAKGIWADWYDEMAKKTVLRRLEKRLPSSADVDQMMEHDNEVFDMVESDTEVEIESEPIKQEGETRASKIIEEAEVMPDDAGPSEEDDIPI